MHCCAVARASAVSVIVIDCTTIGAPPPTWTRPTFTPTVLWCFTTAMEVLMIASRLRSDPWSAKALAERDNVRLEIMKAIGVHEFGGPEGMNLQAVRDP